MSPIHRPHVAAVVKLHLLLQGAFAQGFYIQVQSPLAIGDSEPEPDLAVVAGSVNDYANHPTTAALVAEVADTSLAFDLGDKASLYASANIREYWVLDLNARQLVVHRNPQPDSRARFAFSYAQIQTFAADQSIVPLGIPAASLKIADMLP